MAKNKVREKIIKLLSNHPEGLTFAQISRQIGMHRNTITKYIYELSGAGIVKIRDLKTLKLCYLSDEKTASKFLKELEGGKTV